MLNPQRRCQLDQGYSYPELTIRQWTHCIIRILNPKWILSQTLVQVQGIHQPQTINQTRPSRLQVQLWIFQSRGIIQLVIRLQIFHGGTQSMWCENHFRLCRDLTIGLCMMTFLSMSPLQTTQQMKKTMSKLFYWNF